MRLPLAIGFIVACQCLPIAGDRDSKLGQLDVDFDVAQGQLRGQGDSIQRTSVTPKPQGYSLVPFYADTVTNFIPPTGRGKHGTVLINDRSYGTSYCSAVTRTDIVPTAAKLGSYCFARSLDTGPANSVFIYFDKKSLEEGSRPIRELRLMLFGQEMGTLQFGDEIPILASKITELTEHLGNPVDKDSMWFPISLDVYKSLGVTHYAYIPGSSAVPGLDEGFIYWKDGAAYHWQLIAPCLEPSTTTYDTFVEKQPKSSSLSIDNSTLLLVIDMQNDFVTGSFKMPCVSKIKALIPGIVHLIEATSSAGGTVIASMDYHSPEHCSFKGLRNVSTNERIGSETCKNEVFLTEADTKMERYHNKFPPHTQFEEIEGEQGSPTYPMFGARLEPQILQALGSATEKAAQSNDTGAVEIVFKGFNDDKDSFSAMQHITAGESEEGDLNEEKFTGAFALMEGMPSYCFEGSPGFDCFPTRAQLDEPSMKMRSMTRIIQKRLTERPVKQVLVTGLVFDFCVKETAIYTKQFVEHLFPKGDGPRVMIPMALARPALEGLPGVAGPLASMPYLDGSAAEMRNAGVELVEVAA